MAVEVRGVTPSSQRAAEQWVYMAEDAPAANRELLTLHELIAHRLVQILLGLHRGRTFSMPG